LTTEIDKAGGLAPQGNFLHAEEVIVVFDLVFNFLADLFDALINGHIL
jgi:hypothetical protein